MATLKYIGDRPYVEFSTGNTTFGFARGTERTDVPIELLEQFKGDNYPQWKVIDLAKEEAVVVKTEKMIEAIEAVEEVTTEVEAFDNSWTRAGMVEWMKARGQSVSKADTKAILAQRADALTSKGDE